MQKLSEGSSQENRHERLFDNARKDAEAMGGDRMGTGGQEKEAHISVLYGSTLVRWETCDSPSMRLALAEART